MYIGLLVYIDVYLILSPVKSGLKIAAIRVKMDIFEREKMLIGDEAVKRLSGAKVALFGVGGVGGYVAEILARAGVGTIAVVDNDVVSPSNINRQIIATHLTIGKSKVMAACERLFEINPKINARPFEFFYDETTCDEIDLSKFDFIVDAIDTVTSKLLLIQNAKAVGVKIISCMGTGNKYTTDFLIDDISKTSVCPLCKVMRKELKVRNISGVPVLYSLAKPKKPQNQITENGRHIPSSISFAPAAAGIKIGEYVIKELLKGASNE